MSDNAHARRRAVTIKDVARHAGVSQGVVSRVLNDGIGPVAPATRQRVQASIKELQYRPHAAARELKTQTTSTIGLIVADVANEFFARLADHVVRAARTLGLGVLLTTTQEDPGLESASVEMMIDKRVRGIIAAPTGRNPAIWRQVTEMGAQLVFVDRTLDRVPRADVVGIDNEAAAFAATQHLIETGIGGSPSSAARSPSPRAANGSWATGGRWSSSAPTRTRARLRGRLRRPTAGGAVETLLALKDPVTAVVVSNAHWRPR